MDNLSHKFETVYIRKRERERERDVKEMRITTNKCI